MSLSGDDRLYAKAADELESGEKDQDLWTRALTHAEFDEAKAREDYVETRVAQMKLELAGEAGDEIEEPVSREPLEDEAKALQVKIAARRAMENYLKNVHKRGDMKYILAAIALITIVFFWSNC